MNGDPQVQINGIYRIFQTMSAPARVRFIAGLVDMLLPFELRFIGTLIEEIARSTYNDLRIFETANCKAEQLHNFQNLTRPEVRAHLIMLIALLQGANVKVAEQIYRFLHNAMVTITDKDVLYSEDYLLLFTLSAYHPAMYFHQKCTLQDYIAKLDFMYKQQQLMTELDPRAAEDDSHEGITPRADLLQAGIGDLSQASTSHVLCTSDQSSVQCNLTTSSAIDEHEKQPSGSDDAATTSGCSAADRPFSRPAKSKRRRVGGGSGNVQDSTVPNLKPTDRDIPRSNELPSKSDTITADDSSDISATPVQLITPVTGLASSFVMDPSTTPPKRDDSSLVESDDLSLVSLSEGASGADSSHCLTVNVNDSGSSILIGDYNQPFLNRVHVSMTRFIGSGKCSTCELALDVYWSDETSNVAVRTLQELSKFHKKLIHTLPPEDLCSPSKDRAFPFFPNRRALKQEQLLPCLRRYLEQLPNVPAQYQPLLREYFTQHRLSVRSDSFDASGSSLSEETTPTPSPSPVNLMPGRGAVELPNDIVFYHRNDIGASAVTDDSTDRKSTKKSIDDPSTPVASVVSNSLDQQGEVDTTSPTLPHLKMVAMVVEPNGGTSSPNGGGSLSPLVSSDSQEGKSMGGMAAGTGVNLDGSLGTTSSDISMADVRLPNVDTVACSPISAPLRVSVSASLTSDASTTVGGDEVCTTLVPCHQDLSYANTPPAFYSTSSCQSSVSLPASALVSPIAQVRASTPDQNTSSLYDVTPSSSTVTTPRRHAAASSTRSSSPKMRTYSGSFSGGTTPQQQHAAQYQHNHHHNNNHDVLTHSYHQDDRINAAAPHHHRSHGPMRNSYVNSSRGRSNNRMYGDDRYRYMRDDTPNSSSGSEQYQQQHINPKSYSFLRHHMFRVNQNNSSVWGFPPGWGRKGYYNYVRRRFGRICLDLNIHELGQVAYKMNLEELLELLNDKHHQRESMASYEIPDHEQPIFIKAIRQLKSEIERDLDDTLAVDYNREPVAVKSVNQNDLNDCARLPVVAGVVSVSSLLPESGSESAYSGGSWRPRAALQPVSGSSATVNCTEFAKNEENQAAAMERTVHTTTANFHARDYSSDHHDAPTVDQPGTTTPAIVSVCTSDGHCPSKSEPTSMQQEQLADDSSTVTGTDYDFVTPGTSSASTGVSNQIQGGLIDNEMCNGVSNNESARVSPTQGKPVVSNSHLMLLQQQSPLSSAAANSRNNQASPLSGTVTAGGSISIAPQDVIDLVSFRQQGILPVIPGIGHRSSLLHHSQTADGALVHMHNHRITQEHGDGGGHSAAGQVNCATVEYMLPRSSSVPPVVSPKTSAGAGHFGPEQVAAFVAPKKAAIFAGSPPPPQPGMGSGTILTRPKSRGRGLHHTISLSQGDTPPLVGGGSSVSNSVFVPPPVIQAALQQIQQMNSSEQRAQAIASLQSNLQSFNNPLLYHHPSLQATNAGVVPHSSSPFTHNSNGGPGPPSGFHSFLTPPNSAAAFQSNGPMASHHHLNQLLLQFPSCGGCNACAACLGPLMIPAYSTRHTGNGAPSAFVTPGTQLGSRPPFFVSNRPPPGYLPVTASGQELIYNIGDAYSQSAEYGAPVTPSVTQFMSAAAAQNQRFAPVSGLTADQQQQQQLIGLPRVMHSLLPSGVIPRSNDDISTIFDRSNAMHNGQFVKPFVDSRSDSGNPVVLTPATTPGDTQAAVPVPLDVPDRPVCCCNCGEMGHRLDLCSKPNMMQLSASYRISYEDKNGSDGGTGNSNGNANTTV